MRAASIGLGAFGCVWGAEEKRPKAVRIMPISAADIRGFIVLKI